MRGAQSSLRRAAWAHTAAATTPDPRASHAPVRIFLVADVSVYRGLLVHALAGEEDIEVVGSSQGDVASVAIRNTEPAVVLVDAARDSGPAQVRALAAAAPGVKIVAVGIPDDEAVLLELVEAGIAGYVTAEQSLGELIATVEAAANGELRCSPRLSAVLAERLAALTAGLPRRSRDHKLTSREREIAALVTEGLSNKQIAERLSIERATVKNHVHNVLAKLGVTRRDEVATVVRTSTLLLLSAATAENLWRSWPGLW